MFDGDRGCAAHAHAGARQPERAPELGEHEPAGELILEVEQRAWLGPAVAERVNTGGNPTCPVEQRFLGARDFREPRGHSRVDLLPDAGHSEDDRGLHFTKVVCNLGERLCIVDGRAAGRRRVDGQILLGDMRQRQVRQTEIIACQLDQLLSHFRGPGDVLVREHGPLGGARRARGINDACQILGHDRLESLVQPIIGHLFCSGVERLPCHHERILDRCHASGEDHVFQQRKRMTLCLDLLPLLDAVEEERVCLCMIHDVLDLLGRARRVDANADAAGAHGSELADRPLGTVEPQLRDLAAWLEPERDQGPGGTAHLGDVRLPGRRSPNIPMLDVICRSMRAMPSLLHQARGYGIGVHGGSSVDPVKRIRRGIIALSCRAGAAWCGAPCQRRRPPTQCNTSWLASGPLPGSSWPGAAS